jgi:hypothetical protein
LKRERAGENPRAIVIVSYSAGKAVDKQFHVPGELIAMVGVKSGEKTKGVVNHDLGERSRLDSAAQRQRDAPRQSWMRRIRFKVKAPGWRSETSREGEEWLGSEGRHDIRSVLLEALWAKTA